MSWLPVFNSLTAFVIIPSLFLWYWSGIYFSVFLLVVCFFYLSGEVVSLERRYAAAFLVFVASEFIIFITLFSVSLWYDKLSCDSISDHLSLPLLGRVLLLTSSFFVRLYHHVREEDWSHYIILVVIFFGLCFVSLQVFEFGSCFCDSCFNAFYSCSFATTGLHFLHVLLGVFALGFLFSLGFPGDDYYSDLCVWYWHFVDYVWLWVYLVVYVI